MGRSFLAGSRKSQYLKIQCDTHEQHHNHHHHPNAFVVDFLLFYYYYYYYFYYPVPNLGKHSPNHQAKTFLMSFWPGCRWKERQGVLVAKTP
jgi:hypothetical protein